MVPGVRRFQLQPGATVPVRVDAKKLSRVVIDWDRHTAGAMGQLGALGLALPGLSLPGGAPVAAAPLVATMPSVQYTGTESPEALRAVVREAASPAPRPSTRWSRPASVPMAAPPS
jgi:hypothetical protein